MEEAEAEGIGAEWKKSLARTHVKAQGAGLKFVARVCACVCECSASLTHTQLAPPAHTAVKTLQMFEEITLTSMALIPHSHLHTHKSNYLHLDSVRKSLSIYEFHHLLRHTLLHPGLSLAPPMELSTNCHCCVLVFSLFLFFFFYWEPQE